MVGGFPLYDREYCGCEMMRYIVDTTPGTLLPGGVPKNDFIWLEELIITRENNEVCTVRSLDLANFLCNNGYKMKKVIDSEKNPRFKVFLFEDSKAIQNCIATYLSHKEA